MTKKELNLLIEELKNVKMEEIEFSTGSGGIPEYNKELEKDIVDMDENFMYETPQNGNAYAGWIKLICGKTRFVDHYGDTIYISKNGFVFTEDYKEGSPADFDGCILDTPVIRINSKFIDINEFIKIEKNYKEFLKHK